MLDGASKYLNNLLLARGLLTDGKPIDFPQLAVNSDETKTTQCYRSTTTTKTTTTIINLIHDIILRRDRDAEKHEALATTIHILRTEESQRLLDFQKLQDKTAQLTNDLSTSEARQRNLLLLAKKAQADVKDFKEQNLKMKSTVDQIRAKCVNDIRKRDTEIEKLKSLLSASNRGSRRDDMHMARNGATKNSRMPSGREGRGTSESSNGQNTTDWTLDQESNDFLTAVVNETTTENVALRKIVGDSLTYLKSLTGLDEHEREQEQTQAASIADSKPIGIPGQYREDRNADNASAGSDSITPVHDLASSMSEVLSHCQSILRDPSFVPIEEVHVRDEEILKLRGGWEKMADRWKEAVTMMSQWRQKMMGDAHDMHEHRGLDDVFSAEGLSGIAAFGRSVAVRPNGKPILDPVEEEELTSMLIEHHSRIMANQSTMSDGMERQIAYPALNIGESVLEPDGASTPKANSFQIHADESDAELEELHLEPRPQQIIASPARRGIKLQPPSSSTVSESRPPLSNTNANAKKRKSPDSADPSSPRKRRSVSPAPSPAVTSELSSTLKNSSTAHDSTLTSDSIDPLQMSHSDSENEDDNEDIDLFLPDNSAKEKSKIPRLTVAQKLAAVEAEATEATEVIRVRQATTYDSADRRAKDRVRKRKAEAAADNEKISNLSSVKRVAKGTSKQQNNGGSSNSASKDKLKKVRDRRRSTLTPRELGALMGQ